MENLKRGCRVMSKRRRYIVVLVAIMSLIVGIATLADAEYKTVNKGDALDLSVLLSQQHPCWWPGHAEYVRYDYRVIGPGAFRTHVTIIDEHTGTHFDAAPHFVPPPASGLPHATAYGVVTGEKIPIWQFVGEACVIDVTSILDNASPGYSPEITPDMVEKWEKEHRPLGEGDVVIFYSGYSDKYYKPLPEGRRLVADPLAGKAPGWPSPSIECIKYLLSKGVKHVATDGASMGHSDSRAAAVHWEGLGGGMIFTELLSGVGSVPNGSFFAFLPVKTEGSSGGPGRAVAIVDKELSASLNDSAKKAKIVDLSVTLAPDLPCWWPGTGVGDYSYIYMVAPFNDWTGFRGPYLTRAHIFDAHTGTHFDSPTHFLPDPGFDDNAYNDFVKGVLVDYNAKYGPRPTSSVYAADVPVEEMMGPARIIDVTDLIGTTKPSEWPKSPAITVDQIKRHEELYGPIEKGEVVLFKTGHDDRYYLPFPYGDKCAADPLNGKSEGWPAPTAEAMIYLAEKGVKCVGIDAPSMGAVTSKEAIQTHWAGLSRGINYVEFLTNLGDLPPKGAFFIFGPLKEEGGKGANGRAIAILP
jgi:kynurenine formamidase